MGGPSSSRMSEQDRLAKEQADTASQARGQSAEMYAASKPGFDIAEKYYQAIASGDPNKIFSAVAPAVGGIQQQTERAKEMITANVPRGGVQQLALAQADIAKAGQIGNLETQAYTGSFPALASLAGQGMGISVNEMANAIAGFQGAGQTNASTMQMQAQGKAATMGFLGSLAGAAGAAAA